MPPLLDCAKYYAELKVKSDFLVRNEFHILVMRISLMYITTHHPCVTLDRKNSENETVFSNISNCHTLRCRANESAQQMVDNYGVDQMKH